MVILLRLPVCGIVLCACSKCIGIYTAADLGGEARGAIAPPPSNVKEYKKLNVLI